MDHIYNTNLYFQEEDTQQDPLAIKYTKVNEETSNEMESFKAKTYVSLNLLIYILTCTWLLLHGYWLGPLLPDSHICFFLPW